MDLNLFFSDADSIEDHLNEIMDEENPEGRVGLNICFTIEPDQIVVSKLANYACMNGCGNYGRRYSCPPKAIKPEKMREFLSKWDKVLIIGVAKTLDDLHKMENGHHDWDHYSRAGKALLGSTTNKYMERILPRIQSLLESFGYKTFGLQSGSCHICKTCACAEGKPCRHPKLMHMAAEGTGIDVCKTMTNVGYPTAMPTWDNVHAVAMILLKGDGAKELNLTLTRREALQTYPEGFQIDDLKNENLVSNLQIVEVKDLKRLDESHKHEPIESWSCQHGREINVNDYKLAVVWKWVTNDTKTRSYEEAMASIHKKTYYQNKYFAVSIRDSPCLKCDLSEEGESPKHGCFYMKPAPGEVVKGRCRHTTRMGICGICAGIDMSDFGPGRWGIELIE